MINMETIFNEQSEETIKNKILEALKIRNVNDIKEKYINKMRNYVYKDYNEYYKEYLNILKFYNCSNDYKCGIQYLSMQSKSDTARKGYFLKDFSTYLFKNVE